MEAKSAMKMAKKLDSLGEDDKDFVVLSSGVELYVKQAPPVILIQIMTAQKRPDPPEVFMKEIGKSIINSDDPDYISRVKAWEMEYNSGMLYALVSLGTSLKSKPKGMAGPDSNEWIEDYKSLKLPVMPESKSWRYTTWVFYLAAPTDKDIAAIGDAVKRLSGVREADVKDAETFPGSDQEGRGS